MQNWRCLYLDSGPLLLLHSKFVSKSLLTLLPQWNLQLGTGVRFISDISCKRFPFHGTSDRYAGNVPRIVEVDHHGRRFLGSAPRNDNILPPLMENVPFFWWSSFFSRIKMWFQIRFTIRKLDPSFTMQDFLTGAHKALTVVSEKLANKDYQGLEQFFENSALNEIKRNIVRFSDLQSQALMVDKNDAYICFPHHIKITAVPHRSSHTEVLEGKPTPRPERIVQIVVVFHVWRGATMEEVRERSVRTMMRKEYVKNFLICNYTFKRNYADPENSWDISSLFYYCLNPSREEGGSSERDAPRKRRRRSKSK
ncbi:unnamed protein product [Allacma fusca]|uniref:Tim44-like domain-containing protein n=1 Tax=Allacma fusca TaxID=39272 RepID=A0A8J2K0D3_9HEXA|nr:unnamed protein product [Allacma fusca]